MKIRYIAIVSVISVTLGVATFIVLDIVMPSFSTEMKARSHEDISDKGGVSGNEDMSGRGDISNYGDIVISSNRFDGFSNVEMQAHIRKVAGDKIEAMTPIVVVPSMLNLKTPNGWISKPVQVVGIDVETYPLVSDFGKYLQHPEHRKKPSFNLLEEGYDSRDHQLGEGEKYVPREQMEKAGWKYRRAWAKYQKFSQQADTMTPTSTVLDTESVKTLAPPTTNTPASRSYPASGFSSAIPGQAMASNPFMQETNPFDQHKEATKEKVYDPEIEQRPGIIIGMSLISSRNREGRDWFAAVPGNDVSLIIPTIGQPPRGVSDTFTIVDVYESKMSEFDSQLVFVPIQHIQKLRGMIDPISPTNNRVNQILIKLKPGISPIATRDILRKAFDPRLFSVMTWTDM